MEDYYRISFKYGKVLTDLQKILQTLESEEEQQEEEQEGKQEEKQEEVCSQPSPECLNVLFRSLRSKMKLRVRSPNPNAGKKICTRWRNKYRYPIYSTS